jgi:beta-glucanase (GH16 family)
MKHIKFAISLFLLSIFSIGLIYAQKSDKASPKKGYKLVWADEFDYQGLPDAKKWSYDTLGNNSGWGNNEAQFYTAGRKKNVWVHDGVLSIIAQKEDFRGKKYTSTRLITKDKGDWLYGRFEIKAKLPVGKGMWPAIWMLSSDWVYGSWPASGEIDIMENVGYKPDSIYGSLHTQSYYFRINTQKTKGVAIPDNHTAFHVYALEWDPQEIRLIVDDIAYLSFSNEHNTYKEWPFDKRFHLLLNVAVGGDWGGQQGIDDRIFPQTMDVDYVRVYQKTDAKQ